MSEPVVLYYNPLSRARIVHWMLEESGAPYRVELLSLEKGDHKKPSFLAINPMGKVPAIVHRNTVVTECGAICAYLADAFPASGLAPAADDPARGTYLRWMFFGAGCIEPALIDHLYSRPVPERPGAIGYGNYIDTLNAVEKALAPGPYILGERFSAADVYVGSQLAWGMMMKGIEPRATFQSYVERLSKRPAYLRFSQQADEYAARLKANT